MNDPSLGCHVAHIRRTFTGRIELQLGIGAFIFLRPHTVKASSLFQDTSIQQAFSNGPFDSESDFRTDTALNGVVELSF